MSLIQIDRFQKVGLHKVPLVFWYNQLEPRYFEPHEIKWVWLFIQSSTTMARISRSLIILRSQHFMSPIGKKVLPSTPPFLAKSKFYGNSLSRHFWMALLLWVCCPEGKITSWPCLMLTARGFWWVRWPWNWVEKSTLNVERLDIQPNLSSN